MEVLKRNKVKKLYNIFIVAILLAGCSTTFITGSGNTIIVTREYSDFNKIDISDAIDVIITQGNTYSIEIEVDDNLVHYLKTSKSGNTLIIELENGKSYNNINIQAYIELPDINKIELSGASQGYVTGFKFNHSLNCELSGASYLSGQINTGDVNFDLSGASDISLVGTADDLNLSCSGASDAELTLFPVDDADIELSGGSDATITVDGVLNAELSGGSHLGYYGNPTINNLDISGGSTITNRN